MDPDLCIVLSKKPKSYKCFTREEAKIILETNNGTESELRQIDRWLQFDTDLEIEDWLNNGDKVLIPEKEYPYEGKENVRYFSFPEFKSLLCNAFKQFIEVIGSKEWYVLTVPKFDEFDENDKPSQKSNNWATRIISSSCALGYRPVDIIKMFPTFSESKHENYGDKKFDNVKDIVIIDDASYSGTQISLFVDKINKRYNQTINIHIILAVLKNKARQYLVGQYGNKFHFYIGEEIMDDSDFYFSHKLPDTSSVNTKEIAKNIPHCGDYYGWNKKNYVWDEMAPACPPPPYKRSNVKYEIDYYNSLDNNNENGDPELERYFKNEKRLNNLQNFNVREKLIDKYYSE